MEYKRVHPVINIIKITRPKHILKAFISPLNTCKAIKYHLRRVSQLSFITFLSTLFGQNQYIDDAYRDFKRNSGLWEEIQKELSIYPGSYGLQMAQELPVLYILTRLMKPAIIVETGVSSGSSSAYILQALHDNQKGKLYSIDLPPKNLPSGKKSGFVVPQYLSSRWELRIGDSKDLLLPLLNDIGPIDSFIHDSLHTYDHMMFEFRTVWDFMRSPSLFLSHDVGRNKAFFDFMNEKQISWKDYRVYYVLGGFQKV